MAGARTGATITDGASTLLEQGRLSTFRVAMAVTPGSSGLGKCRNSQNLELVIYSGKMVSKGD